MVPATLDLENWEAMDAREEIAVDIRELEAEIRELETERESATIDKDERSSLDAIITSKNAVLAALIASQQGNFS